MNGDDAKDKTPPEGARPPEPRGETRTQKAQNDYERLHVEYHRIEARSAQALVLITGIASLIGIATLVLIFFQTKDAKRAADAAAAAASIAAGALQETKAQATAESTTAAQQLAKLGQTINAQTGIANATLRVAQETAENAVIARGSLRLAQQTLDVNERDFLIEQRPWVGVFIPQIVPDSKPDASGRYQFHAGISVINFGRSAAKNITIAWNVRTDDSGHASDEADAFFAQPEQDWHWQNSTPLPPGAGPALPQAGFAAHWGPYEPARVIVLARTWNSLALYGRVRYTDFRGRHYYHTDFCVFGPGVTTISCDRHNYLE